MPRVKLDYVVSFSSEDPDNPASNLLAWDISKRKWLCSKWEPSCSVVLQLAKAVQIQSVHIGAYQSSLVEVLVGLSEKPNDPFEVLVPSCVLVAPGEARRGAAERVRTFGAEQLAAARARRWDRLRLVCTQPYNKHCKYGLSFVHVYSPEVDPRPPSAPITDSTQEKASKAIPSRMFILDGLSSDEEEFKPGELFAKHQAAGTSSTDAQIRQASSNALKNISDSCTKLTKTAIARTSEARRKHSARQVDDEQTNRQRTSLLYTDDDDRPHDRIDKVVQKHRDERGKEETNRQKAREPKRNTIHERMKDLSNEIDREVNESIRKDVRKDEGASGLSKRKRASLNASRETNLNESTNKDFNKVKRDNSDDTDEPRKRKKVDNNDGVLRAGPVCSDSSQILAGVVFAMSGYAHPRRGALRDCALALGARYRPDYTADCTHLICAFPNTPKLRSARAAGAPCVAVTGEWLQQCAAARRRLPPQWFATEPHLYVAPPSGGYGSPPPPPPPRADSSDADDAAEGTGDRQPARRRLGETASRGDSDADTDDEIEQVRREQAQRHEQPTDGHTDTRGDDSDRSDDTEPGARARELHRLDHTKLLPNFLEGYTFVIAEALRGAGHEPERLARYVRAYGGLVLPEEQVDEESCVHYLVCGSVRDVRACAGVRVSPRWLWRAHALGRRPSDSEDDVQ